MTMNNWKRFVETVIKSGAALNEQRARARADLAVFGVYPESIRQAGGSTLLIAREEDQKVLVVLDYSPVFDQFGGAVTELFCTPVKVCPLDLANCQVIRALFPFTRPTSHQGRPITIGLGDRLGLASPGHIRVIRRTDAFPVLAQQSIRELTLTGRTYDDVLAAASWAVYQEGYELGFGADGDHLKTAAEVRMALDCGVTMITLDCSEQIRNDLAALDDEAVAEHYAALPAAERLDLEARYSGKTFLVDGVRLVFTAAELHRIALVYGQALRHARSIYQDLIAPCERQIDFELSIDETLTPTTQCAHYLVAAELLGSGVRITSLAPRFVGEFQKGIDYIGDIADFTREFAGHSHIARHFGYKISVHSGSDKFSVFPIVGDLTGGVYHLKTAGTNWLEAVRVMARREPALYRELHAYALEHLAEARQYYHISADLARIPDLADLSDAELPGLMDRDESRQLIHITYGLLLKARTADGTNRFRSRIYQTLARYEDDYMAALEHHIGRHLSTLGVVAR
jgi:hypothetical protein